MAVATLADEAMGAVRAALRAVDDAMETLGKHRARMYGLLERLETDRDGTKAEVDREEWTDLRDGLAFYADEANWDLTVLYEVPKGEPNEGARHCQPGPAIYRGAHARQVLEGGERLSQTDSNQDQDK